MVDELIFRMMQVFLLVGIPIGLTCIAIAGWVMINNLVTTGVVCR
jgi:hypothetical protein